MNIQGMSVKEFFPDKIQLGVSLKNCILMELHMELKNTLLKEKKNFEKGIKLTNQCQQALADAEQKVEILMQQQETISSE